MRKLCRDEFLVIRIHRLVYRTGGEVNLPRTRRHTNCYSRDRSSKTGARHVRRAATEHLNERDGRTTAPNGDSDTQSPYGKEVTNLISSSSLMWVVALCAVQ